MQINKFASIILFIPEISYKAHCNPHLLNVLDKDSLIMNKSDLINAIAEHANLTKADAGRALESLLITIETALKAGDPVVLIGFGTFAVKERAERTHRSQSTNRSGNHYCSGKSSFL